VRQSRKDLLNPGVLHLLHVEREEFETKFWLDPLRLERSRGFGRTELLRLEALVIEQRAFLLRSTSGTELKETVAQSVAANDEALIVDLADGRTITVPLSWFPRLAHGTPAERANWRLIGAGVGIHWPDLDEDISVESLLAGRRSGETQESLRRWLQTRTGPSRSSSRLRPKHG
jgi:hypothetical protein